MADFHIGDRVTRVDGRFEGQPGTVTAVRHEQRDYDNAYTRVVVHFDSGRENAYAPSRLKMYVEQKPIADRFGWLSGGKNVKAK